MAAMSELPRRWTCASYSLDAADELARELGVSTTAAAILARRGHLTPAAARRFLAAEERHDPFLFPDMTAACDLILAHIERGSRIVVHGDFDVDGVCSTAVLVRGLRELDADPAWHLPSRFDGGYGLLPQTVERLADAGTGLLITVDCGITAVDEVAAAIGRGIDVLVTDHHRPPDRLPGCPIVHPAVGGYPFPDLCAAGVAHKLVEALFSRAGLNPARADDDLDLVGLATVADLVPMRGENRRLVRRGLRELSRTTKPGLRALMSVAALDPGSLDARAAGFRLAPRLNAAGRLGRADAALELLLTEGDERAAEVADELDQLNAERRDAETRMLFAAEAARAEVEDAPLYVLAGRDWHPGVIGIVASRLAERHHRPCVLVSLGPEGGRGSGRSIPAYDLHAGLTACAGLLRRFGGHAMAAGFQVDSANVDSLRSGLVAHAAATLSPADLVPVERVDAVVPARALGIGLAEELAVLGPFGHGNPEPTLLVPAARLQGATAMGESGTHSRFTLASGGARAGGVAFGTAPSTLGSAAGEPADVAVRLERREWNGAVEARVVLRAVCSPARGRCRILGLDASTGSGGAIAGVERELTGDPASWAASARPPVSSAGEEAPRRGVNPARPPQPFAARRLCDRRGEGVAGVAGEVISSGAPLLIVCADISRRVEALERLVAGLGGRVEGAEAGDPPMLTLVSWDELAANPELARDFRELVAVDPPPAKRGEALLAAGGSPQACGRAQLAWGAPEADFALAVAEAQLDLRGSLAGLYRRLREAGTLAGVELERALAGEGPHPRPPAVCGRLVRILTELGLVHWHAAGGEASCTVLEAPSTALERSPAYRAYLERLAVARRHLVLEGARPDWEAASA